jgi:hypothetical protein
MKLIARLAVVAGALIVAGCHTTSDSIVKEIPPQSATEARVTEAVAHLHSVDGNRHVGKIQLSTEKLVVSLTQPLKNLPPDTTLYLTVREHRATTAEEVGPVVDLRGTSDTGVLASVGVDAQGNGTLTNKTTVVYFLYDKLVGHNLVLADADGTIAATGILGIAAEK